MTFRTLLLVKAAVCLAFGLLLLIAPAALFDFLGTKLGDGGMFTAREYGAALIGTLLLAWFARNIKAADARGAILIDLFIYDLIGTLVTLMVVLSGILNWLGWESSRCTSSSRWGLAICSLRKSPSGRKGHSREPTQARPDTAIEFGSGQDWACTDESGGPMDPRAFCDHAHLRVIMGTRGLCNEPYLIRLFALPPEGAAPHCSTSGRQTSYGLRLFYQRHFLQQHRLAAGPEPIDVHAARQIPPGEGYPVHARLANLIEQHSAPLPHDVVNLQRRVRVFGQRELISVVGLNGLG